MTTTDYEEFALDIIQTVLDSGNYKPTTVLVARVGKMLETGPMITVWPKDVAEARQRARDRAIAAAHHRPELPRVVMPLPPLKLPELPRVVMPLPPLKVPALPGRPINKG